MADFTLGGFSAVPPFVDKRRGRGGVGADVVAEVANMMSVSLLRARLTALKPTAYTAARLNSMTRNDMIYAVRKESADTGGI